ncbi:DUF654-domain-containing protein [Myriangium duriaei CBS 260.36]|uniref:DUF654-domain-containing protein n=1 Tax=Myriangium duriaei CBS 260.36 TaxID=1168546 RepID=A0A9P4J7T1_9PEZI|nr:DUF654-domain-containing protein [Myriangium duriaei CBS 260.36]
MSSRALRRAQKQKEEEETLKRLQEEAEALESSEEDEVDVQPQRSAFALLNDQDEDESEHDVDEDDTKKASDDTPEEESQPEAVLPSKTAPKRKKKKKAKSKAQATDSAKQPPDDGSVDDIDAALKSLATTSKASDAGAAEHVDPELVDACKLLSIDSQNLHAENEMRRLFGRAAMESNDEDEQQQNAQGRRRNRQQMGGLAAALGRRQGAQGGRTSGLGLLGLRRNLFMQGKEEWPIGTSGGLGMEIVEKRPNGIVEYRFVHNNAYQDVQADFDVCVRGMDPERMIRLLQINPYHISTLLQVSEIAKQERDHTTSGDLLERALFSFGRALHSTFASNLAQGKARFDFRRPENREFWLAVSRYMTNLSMRATWRTVFEWAKLLLSLDPENDPYRMCLSIDQYAIRARQAQQLLDLAANPLIGAPWPQLPNMQLSLALAHVQANQPSKGKQALFTAANRIPWALALLFQELNLDAPPGIWGASPRTDWEKLTGTLYATRGKDLWSSPEAQQLLLEVASAVSGSVSPAPPLERSISIDEGRHVLLADLPPLIALLPREITGRLTGSSDPLPPADEVRSYIPRGGRADRGAARTEDPVAAREELRGIYAMLGRFAPAMQALLAREQQGQVSEQDVDEALQGSGMTRTEFEAWMHRFDELLASGGLAERGIEGSIEGEMEQEAQHEEEE